MSQQQIGIPGFEPGIVLPLAQLERLCEDGVPGASDKQMRNLRAVCTVQQQRWQDKINKRVRDEQEMIDAGEAALRERCREDEREAQELTAQLESGLIDPEAAEQKLRRLFRRVRAANELLAELHQAEERNNQLLDTAARDYEAQMAARFPALFTPDRDGYARVTQEILDGRS